MATKFGWRKVIFSINAAATLMLAACVAPPNNYMQPPELTPQTGATIIGSMVINPDPLAPNTRVVLSEVDNQYTQMTWHDWKKPLLVTPGIHLLTFGPCYCNGLEFYAGFATLYGNFEAGKTYTLASTRALGFLAIWNATIWIEDESGAVITPKTPVQLGPPGGYTTVIPIFIPRK